MTEFELRQKMNQLSNLLATLKMKEAEFEKQTCDLVEEINGLKSELKNEILSRGKSVVTDNLVGSYRKGAVKWDTSWLDGFAIDHPEYHLGQYRKIGDPTVAFSFPKEKK